MARIEGHARGKLAELQLRRCVSPQVASDLEKYLHRLVTHSDTAIVVQLDEAVSDQTRDAWSEQDLLVAVVRRGTVYTVFLSRCDYGDPTRAWAIGKFRVARAIILGKEVLDGLS